MNTSQAPRSLLRLLQLFEILAEDTPGLTLTELSTALKAPKTSLLNLLPTLVAKGYLVVGDGRYDIGPKMFTLAGAVTRRRQFTVFARPTMAALVETIGETASITVLDRNADVAVYVDSIDSKSALNYKVPIGQIRPLYASVAGKVLLAYQPAEYITRYFETTKLVPRTAHTITSRRKLMSELAIIRSRGWASTVEESSEGISGFASPIFDGDGQIIATISIGGPTQRLLAKRERCIECVQSAAAQVSESMGYIAPAA